MSKCYTDNHPLIRGGRSQADRQQVNLMPDSFNIDDRKLEDVLLFLSKYAQQVVFHQTDGTRGDWTTFFEDIIPVRIALISKFDIADIEKKYTAQSAQAAQYPTNIHFQLLIDQILDLFKIVNDWQRQLKNDPSLGQVLRNLIQSDLTFALRQFIACLRVAGIVCHYPSSFNFFGYQKDWHLSIAHFSMVDQAIMQQKGVKAQKIALREKLDDIFQTLLEGVSTLVALAPTHLQKSLTNQQNHPPHFALLIAFLRLFQYAQKELNTIGKKHLDFFYRDILRLKEKAAIPDKAHLVFELAKKVTPPVQLTQGTLFKDGKDANGVAIQFGLDEDLLLDKAQIKSLQTLFYQPVTEGSTENGLYVAPIANSADGMGSPFTTQEIHSWPTIGAVTSRHPQFDDQGNPNGWMPYKKAQLGIAFASQVLLLKEGKRTIKLKLDCSQAADTDINKLTGKTAAFCAYLSGEKDWIVKNVSAIVLDETNPKKLIFTIELTSTDEAVTFYDAKVLDSASLPTNWPVLQLIYLPEKDDQQLFECLSRMPLSSAQLDVIVNGFKDLVVQNDFGTQSINSAFLPFSTTPKAGSNFYLGSAEIFPKKWTKTTLNITWEKNPVEINQIYDFYMEGGRTADNYKIECRLRNAADSTWNKLKSPKKSLFTTTADELTQTIEFDTANKATIVEDLESDPFAPNPSHRFLQLTLAPLSGEETSTEDEETSKNPKLPNDPFLIAEYPKAIIRQSEAIGKTFIKINNALYRNPNNDEIKVGSSSDVIVMLNDPTSWEAALPNPPYIPTIKSLSVNYEASDSSDVQMFHLYPFDKTFKKAESTTILPDFNVTEVPQLGGNLFIGLSDLRPGGQLHLFFQIAEGSANPDQTKAAIFWHYLAEDEWHFLRPDIDILSDTTNGLVQSGIIKIALPYDLQKGNNILAKDLYWLRISVPKRMDAIGYTISVHTQAAQASFRPQKGNDLQRLDIPLAAEQITKPVQNIAFLKGLTQPYPTFGGHPQESSAQFYTRISELLRHKGRAITLFDYERLVLQNFPEIYKVKCIPHTLGRRGTTVDHTLAPGYVTLVVVPDLKNLSFTDQLAPKVPLSKLEAIGQFLQKHSSPFARIQVLNPRYEAIQVTFAVKFRTGKSNDFYLTELRKSIQLFLTPWATEGANRIVFGGRIFQSTIINFIEQQPYVEHLQNFEMSTKIPFVAQPFVRGTSARSVLNAGAIQIKPLRKSITIQPFTKLKIEEKQLLTSE